MRRLRKGKDTLRLNQFVDNVLRFSIKYKGRMHNIERVNFVLDTKVYGVPEFYEFRENNKIRMWPIPDKSYQVEIIATQVKKL